MIVIIRGKHTLKGIWNWTFSFAYFHLGCQISLAVFILVYDKFYFLSFFFLTWPLISSNLTTQVASWGAYLLSRDILTVSFAPRDTHEAQVQFALERGVPALIGVLASIRLPYPSRAFDMAHCSRCLIPWGQYGTSIIIL